MEALIKKGLPPVLGKIFRELAGKGPERQYIFLAGNIVTVRIYGYIQNALYSGKLLEDSLMCSATTTYYRKVVRNSKDVISNAMEKICGCRVKNILCDFDVKSNSGVIFLVLDKFIRTDNLLNESYLNFIRNHIRTALKKHTGGISHIVDAYSSDNCLLIVAAEFLGSFTETPFMNDAEMIEANKIFYWKMLKHSVTEQLDEYCTEKISYTDVYCDVDIYNDCAFILLKGELIE